MEPINHFMIVIKMLNFLKYRRYKKMVCFFLAFVFFSCTPEITKESVVSFGQEHEGILIGNVNIFNGVDSILLKNKDVYIRDGIISSISNSGSTSYPEVFFIDGTHKTLMPGLIDAHVHITGSGAVPWKNYKGNQWYNLSAYLFSGITTVHDMGGFSSGLEKIKSQIDNGKKPGPKIYHTHIPITIKNSHPIPITKELLYWPLNRMLNLIYPTINDLRDSEKIITHYKSLKADYIKIVYDEMPPGTSQMPFDFLKELVTQSHIQGLKVFVHIGSPQNAIDAIKAGADVLSHGIWRGKLTEEQADFIAASRVPMVYTLAAFYNLFEIYNGRYSPSHFDSLLVPYEVLQPITMDNSKCFKTQKNINATLAFIEDVVSKHDFLELNFKLLIKKGAKVSVGTDSSLPGTYAGSTYYKELDLLKEFGLSPFEILKSATYENSKLFIEKPDFGFVGVNYKADLLLIDGNPLLDLVRVKNPSQIILRGRLIKRLL